ncbi:hypothetical protein, partial [Yersinia pestis]|uniref:hypothetical protein n=1 Tax=Yersinia pestis TaxID=632 RepID=UPI001ED9C17F
EPVNRLRPSGVHPDVNSNSRLLHPEWMRRFHRGGNKLPHSEARNGNSSYADFPLRDVCILLV